MRSNEQEATEQAQTPQQQPQVVIINSGPSRGVAALLSLIIPGAGQIYKGQVLNGIVWFVVVAVGYMALIAPGVFLHFCCVIGAASGGGSQQVSIVNGQAVVSEVNKPAIGIVGTVAIVMLIGLIASQKCVDHDKSPTQTKVLKTEKAATK